MGTLSGSLGAMLGVSAVACSCVPFLILVVGLPFHHAAAISLAAVIATSTAVSAATAGRQLINLRLGMVLEVATAAGGVAGGVTAQLLPPETLQIMLRAASRCSVAVAVMRSTESGPLPPDAEVGRLGGRFTDHHTGQTVNYAVRRLPLSLFASFLAGNLSTLLGIGGGVVKVPVLVTWSGVPMRVAAATSAFMIGVTATSGAVIYDGHGEMIPALAAAAVLGTQMGSALGLRAAARARARGLRRLLAGVLVVVAILDAGTGGWHERATRAHARPGAHRRHAHQHRGAGRGTGGDLPAAGLVVTQVLLTVGLLVLLLTPVARVAVSVVGYLGERDWWFVLYTSVVLVLLIASFVAAFADERLHHAGPLIWKEPAEMSPARAPGPPFRDRTPGRPWPAPPLTPRRRRCAPAWPLLRRVSRTTATSG